MKTVLLLGSNKGDRLDLIQQAIVQIELYIGQVLKQSNLFETAPWGNVNQGSFINQAVLVETFLDPKALLRKCNSIESKLGRVRFEKYGPRTIDIDIQYYEKLIFEDPELTIPHPEMQHRRFALAPMADIIPHWVHPILNVSIRIMYQNCLDKLPVNRL